MATFTPASRRVGPGIKIEPLERDLRALRVEEKSYGMRLVSERGPDGHGDVVTALSIALAVAKPVSSFDGPVCFVPPQLGTKEADELEQKIQEWKLKLLRLIA